MGGAGLVARAGSQQWRFAERVGETALGVGLAYVVGLLLPRLLKRRIAQ